MPFTALTNSPALGIGVMLNLMATPQKEGFRRRRVGAGEMVEIRFGYCCPWIERATVLESRENLIVLALGAETWTLRPGTGRVDVSGILSDDWVVARGTRGRSGPGFGDEDRLQLS